MDNLSKEIVKRILADVGATPGKLFGKAGLTEKELKLDKTLKIEYEDAIVDHSIYGGQIDLDGSSLRAILVDLTVESDVEFLLLYRFSSMPITAVKWQYDLLEEESLALQGFIRLFNEDKKEWADTSMHMKAQALSGFEQIVSAGLMWKQFSEIDDLYEAALTLM